MQKRLAAPLFVLALVFQTLAVRAIPLRQQSGQPAPTGLALEVTYHKERPPTYQAVPGPDANLNGSWYAFFGRVAAWQPPADSLPVRAVNILSRLEGASVRIEVSVYTGLKYFDKEQPVATYRVSENEKIRVEGLRQYGVEPFEIKLLRMNPLLTDLPSIINNTQSIEVIELKANHSTLPTYTLAVQNLSDKKVAAVGISVLVNGKMQLGSLRRRRDGQTFIRAGGIQEINLSGARTTQLTPAGYLPDSPPNQEILISTVVFEDGSYEGEMETAAQVRGFELGSKLQLPKLIALLEEALNSADASVFKSLEKLKTQAASLTTDVDTADLLDLARGFPTLSQEKTRDLKTSIEVALAGEKFDFLKLIQEFEKSGAQANDQKAFRAWLSANKERYQKSLAQLQAE
jgi:hypothetical protein